MNINEAYELAVKKWQLIVDNDGEVPDNYPPELEGLTFNCSYCEMYFYDNYCKGCPLNMQDIKRGWRGICFTEDHPYLLWDIYNCKENAQAVLDLIIKTKPDEIR